MKHNFSLFLISSILLCAAAPTLVAQGGGTAEPLSCADHSITARAVRSPEGVEAFVQCAYEFVQEVGFEEARRAFNEDERWKSGPTYIFVDEVTPMSDLSRPFVFPPDPSREGLPWGLLIDAFGNDWYREQHRIVNSAGDGWIYYSFLTRISILALARSQCTPALPRIPRLSALNPAHHLRRQAPKPVRPLTDVDGAG